ncbi:MAG: signal peptidase I [Lachnospiraceae bacterium]|nr:signal peptidase I [Lachnospiraceae bacterium]
MVIVVLLCCLLVVPKFFGYQMYHVLSGSMEPEIPVGSLICVQEGEPEAVQDEEVIAFYGSLEDSEIITHRVVKNNIVSGTFRTKGDANEQEDPLPVPYGNYIGTVVFNAPHLGMILVCLTSFYGKLAAAAVIVLGVVLNLIGTFMERKEK